MEWGRNPDAWISRRQTVQEYLEQKENSRARDDNDDYDADDADDGDCDGADSWW